MFGLLLDDECQLADSNEMHLIENLASIIWRKRRLLHAEGACFNQGLKA